MPLRILCGLLIDFSNVSTVAGIIDGTWMFAKTPKSRLWLRNYHLLGKQARKLHMEGYANVQRNSLYVFTGVIKNRGTVVSALTFTLRQP